MHLSTGHYLSIVFSLCIILIISFYARVKVKVSSDFTVGGHNAGILIVTGMFIGTFVGGSCTIGTAQLAFVYGLSAWWFTLGLGVSSLLLALFFAKPIHNTKLETVPQFLSSVYGKKTGLVSVVIMCTSLFITLVPQIISAAALFSTITGMLPVYGAALAVSMTACFIFFGGFWGAGMSGLYKTILLYGALVIGGILAFLWAGGWSGLRNSFPQFPWFSLFGRGIWKDLSGGISLLIGIITSQTTMQALSAATNEKTARLGALFAAFLIPPLGLASIFIGLYMRQNYPSINPVEALPRFILTLNPWFSGLLIATMLITVIGAAAGITLGVSTIVTRDIYQKIRFNSTDRENIFVSRCVIILILIFALFIALSGLESFVLYWSYYALGLRGAALFIPLLVTLFKPDVFLSRTVNISMILAAFTVFMWGTLLGKSEQSIYIGLMVSFAILLIGFMRNRSVGGVKEVKKG